MANNTHPLNDIHTRGKFPCVRVCCLNDKDVCIGCYRSLEEIKLWDQATNLLRTSILQNAELRRQSANGQLI